MLSSHHCIAHLFSVICCQTLNDLVNRFHIFPNIKELYLFSFTFFWWNKISLTFLYNQSLFVMNQKGNLTNFLMCNQEIVTNMKHLGIKSYNKSNLLKEDYCLVNTHKFNMDLNIETIKFQSFFPIIYSITSRRGAKLHPLPRMPAWWQGWGTALFPRATCDTQIVPQFNWEYLLPIYTTVKGLVC